MRRIKITWVLVFTLSTLLGTAEYASAVPPANDDCSSAQAVGNVTNQSFDTTSATFDGPGHFIVGPNIWYVYTAPYTGCATVSLCGSNYDTMLAVYDGSSCPPSLGDLLASNDDFCFHQSEVVFPVISGNQYLIEVGGYFQEKGTGSLSISCSTQSCQPTNDFCYNAEPIGNVTNKAFNTQWATPDGPGHCMTSSNIWYCYTAAYSGDVTVSLCGSMFDTMLAIYDGCSCYPSAGNLIECNDEGCDPPSHASEITFTATAGNQYLIEVGGYNSDSGRGVITISAAGQPSPDNCADALPIGNVENMPFDTTSATFDGPGLCATNSSPNIWYCYTAPCTDDVTVSLCGSSFDTVLAVYNGCGCYPTQTLTCNDDSCGQQSELTFSATAGNQYLIEISGYNASDYGQGLLTISCANQPCVVPNDNCFLAQYIGNVVNQPFDTTCATFDGPGLYITSPNLWYVYTATCSGNATVSLCGSQFDTKLAVYTGSNCYPTSSRLIDTDDDTCGYQSELTFPVTAGNNYLIEVGGYGVQTGQGVISITCVGAIQDKTDLGDAPDSTNNYSVAMTAYPKGGPAGTPAHYPTVFNDGSGMGPYGPIHTNSTIVAHLGMAVTNENEADSGLDSDVVNNINPLANSPDLDQKDDGVIFPVNMPKCSWTTFDYRVNVVDPNADLWVNVWCDWNRDGDWDDDSSTDSNLLCAGKNVPEWAIQNQYLFNLPAGINTITTPAFLSWHNKVDAEALWMRITLSEQPWKGGSNPGMTGNGGSGPQAGYLIGETEDYYFTPKTDCDMCQDMNSDGVIDINDLTIVVNNWLSCCL